MAGALHSPVETSLVDLINDRLNCWRGILNTQISSFSELAEAERQIHNLYEKIANNSNFATSKSISASLMATSGSTEKASPLAALSTSASPIASPKVSEPVAPLSCWLRPLQAHITRSAGDSETFYRFTKETVLVRLEKLRDELKKRGRALKQQLGEAQAKLSKQHEVLTTAMMSHESSWKARIKLGRIAEGQDADYNSILDEAISVTDTFITEQTLRQQVTSFLREKKTFEDTLIDVFRGTRLLEHEMATAIKETVSEAMRVRSQQFAASAELLSEGSQSLRSTEALTEWNESLKVHRLDWDWQLEVPPLDGFIASMLSQIACQLGIPTVGVSEFRDNRASSPPVVIKPIRVIKSGFLARPTTFSRNWTVIFALLTDSAFLHCYTPEDFKLEGGSSPKERPFRIPSPSMRLYGKALSELNHNAAKIVFGSREDATVSSLGSLSPLLSIPLLHPQTTVTPDGKASGEFSFTVIVPGGTSFFSRSERRCVLKSFVEEDMVDWCIALKEAISAAQHRPELPPRRAASTDSSHRAGPVSNSMTYPFEAERDYSNDDHPGHDDFADPDFRQRSLAARGGTETATAAMTATNGTIVESEPSTKTSPISSPIGEMENPWGG